MNLIFISAGIVFIGVAVFLLLRKKLPAIKIITQKNEEVAATESATQPKLPQEHAPVEKEVFDVINKIKNTAVRPQGNQQRNLDREIGGLEEKERKENNEKDVWDGRSEEVDRVGSINQLGGGGKESMIWRIKKTKLDNAKHDKKAKDHHHEGTGKDYDSRSNQAGFMTMVKARTDHQSGGRSL